MVFVQMRKNHCIDIQSLMPQISECFIAICFPDINEYRLSAMTQDRRISLAYIQLHITPNGIKPACITNGQRKKYSNACFLLPFAKSHGIAAQCHRKKHNRNHP